MGVIVILILASLAVATGFLVAFVWAVRSGQFEDTSTPSLRVLSDDTGAGSFEVQPKQPIHLHER